MQRNFTIIFKRISCYLFFVFLLSGFSVNAQKVIQKTPAKQRVEWFNQHEQMVQHSIFKNLPWQFAGPTNISGRMTDAVVGTPKPKMKGLPGNRFLNIKCQQRLAIWLLTRKIRILYGQGQVKPTFFAAQTPAPEFTDRKMEEKHGSIVVW